MIYAFDEADSELTLLPMAARRALDAAGLKLSLASYQTLELAERRELVRLGAGPVVDATLVRQLCARASGKSASALAAYREPDELPAELAVALGVDRPLDRAQWAALRGLDRYVFDKLLRRDKLGRLRQAYDEIVGSGVPRGA